MKTRYKQGLSNPLSKMEVLREIFELVIHNEGSTNAHTPVAPVIPYSDGDRLSEEEAAKFLNCSRKTLTTKRKNGEIPFSRISERKVYYSKIKLTDLLNENEVRKRSA